MSEEFLQASRQSGNVLQRYNPAEEEKETVPFFLCAHYISKVGLLVLTRSLARLLAPHGITVNAVSPGFVDSGSAPKKELASMAKRIPAGYVGAVEDAVSAVRFLLSDEARYVNGANIHLSGGWGI